MFLLGHKLSVLLHNGKILISELPGFLACCGMAFEHLVNVCVSQFYSHKIDIFL